MKTRALLVALVILSLNVLLSGLAEAQRLPTAIPQQEHVEPEPEQEWYGWQIIASDLTSLAVGISTPKLLPATALFWLFGGPTIHMLQGNVRGGLTSFGVRIGVPLATAGVFYLSGEKSYLEAILGFVVGTSLAATIDWIGLSYRDLPNDGKPAQTLVVPSLSVTREATTLGFRGSF